jgi:3-oxoacyl-[acyl-carrier protein] reductase
MFDLTGKTALVTGATGGIGKAIAMALHKAGATIIVTGRNVENLAQIESDCCGRAKLFAADLGKDEEIAKLADFVNKEMGGVDILVNNAGLTKDGLFMRMKDEDFEEVISVNLTSIFKLSKALIMPMMKKQAGRIINISSIVGFTGNPGQVNYSASKAGIVGMSKSMAVELASRNITVNCIAPGFIDTPMTQVLPEEVKQAMLNNIPLKRFGSVEDIAMATVFLASNEAAYITGQTIHVNGGMARI